MSLTQEDFDIIDAIITAKGIEFLLDINADFDFKTPEFIERVIAREQYIAEKHPNEYLIWKLKK